MKITEEWLEQYALPNRIRRLYAKADRENVIWQIYDVFGYYIGELSKDDFNELYRMYFHEEMHADHKLVRVSACNAFARFVRCNGGAAAFGLRDAQFADWQPCDRPFGFNGNNAKE